MIALANEIHAMVAVAVAEMRTARRLARTWVFAVLAISINLAIFGFYAYVEARYSPGLTGRSTARLLMGQFGTYLLTTVLAGLVFLAVDSRARDQRVRMAEALDARPLSNQVLIGGQVAGLAVTIWLVVLVAVGVVQVSGAIAAGLWGVGGTVEPVSVLAFALIDTLPTLLLWCSVVMLFVVAMRNRLVAATTALVLLGSVVWLAPQIPVYLVGALIPITGFADSGSDLVPRFADAEALLQRGAMLVAAVGCVALAAGLHPRLDNRVGSRQLVWGVLITVVGVSGIAFLVERAQGGLELRETWFAVHSRAAGEEATTRADIEELTGNVVIEPGERLSVDVTATLRAPSAYDEGDGSNDVNELVFSLNPGMRVTALRVDGAEAAFTHQHGLLSVALPAPLSAGSRTNLALRAGGIPDPRFAYLDSATDPLKVSASNRLGVLGRDAAVFDDAYVALMPAVHWLPSAGANVHGDDPARRTRDLFNVDLTVHAPGDWLVVALGRRQRIGPGSFRFESKVPVSEVGLFASRFARQAIEVDGVEYEFLMHPSHSQSGDLFAAAGEVLRPRLGEMQRRLENLGIGYPFDGLSIVEVPTRLRTYRGGWRLETDRGPPGVMMLKEHELPVLEWQHRSLRSYFDGDTDDAELTLGWLWGLLDEFNVLHKYAHNLLAVTGARGEGAAALDFVCHELVVALLLGETLQYLEVPTSAHSTDSEDALGSVVAAVLGFLTGDRAPLFGHTMSFADRPHIWERALDTPLSNPGSGGDAKSAVEVLTLRGTRVAHAILDRFGREKVGALLAGVREEYAGRTYRAEEFHAVGNEVGASAASIVGDWLNARSAPGFVVSPVAVVRLTDDDAGNRRYQARVHVRNDESAAGAVFVGVDRQAWLERTEAFPVPGHTTVELGMVTPEPPSQLWLHSYFSRNRIPVRLELPAEIDHTGAVAEGFVGVARSDWRPETPIHTVIDDLDPGFSVEADQTAIGPGPMGRFRPPIQLDLGLPQYSWLLLGSPEAGWLRQEVPSSWGKYRHTMVRSAAGDGNRRVYFATNLTSGRWRLDYHLPHDPLPQLPGESYVEPPFIGQLGRFEMWLRTAAGDRPIEFDGSAAAPGWNKLGVFEVDAGLVSVVVSNRTTGRTVIADAIRWLPVSRQ